MTMCFFIVFLSVILLFIFILTIIKGGSRDRFDLMCYEKCDKVSCNFCSDKEQCKPNLELVD